MSYLQILHSKKDHNCQQEILLDVVGRQCCLRGPLDDALVAFMSTWIWSVLPYFTSPLCQPLFDSFRRIFLGPEGNPQCGVRHTIYRLRCKLDGKKGFVQSKLLLLLNVTRHGQGGIVSCYQRWPSVGEQQLEVFIGSQKHIQHFEIIRKCIPSLFFSGNGTFMDPFFLDIK